MSESKKKKKSALFKDIEDVVSVGALLRPTFVSAVTNLKDEQKEQLLDVLIQVEKELSRSDREIADSFRSVKRVMERTYVMGPMWRFISGRIEETWREVETPGVKELTAVSLLVGILFEETEGQVQTVRRRRSA